VTPVDREHALPVGAWSLRKAVIVLSNGDVLVDWRDFRTFWDTEVMEDGSATAVWN
jgi:hypothetical protein